MLLFFLSLFSIYDLFNCNQEGQPNFNNTSLTDLIHKSVREIDALLKNFQQEIKKEKLALEVDVEYENFKEDQGFNFNSHDDTLEPLTTINFKVLPGYLRSPDETSPATTTAGPSMPLSLMEDTTLPSLIEDTTVPFALVHPLILPALREATDKPIQFSEISTISNQVTPEPFSLARTLSKAQAWVRDRRWTTTPGTIMSARRLETPQLLRTGSMMTESTQTAYTGALLHEGSKGFLYVSVPSSLYTTTSTRSTVAGDVLFSADIFTTTEVTSPNQRFHDIMNTTDEGNVIVFILELTRLVAQKEQRHVQEVVAHSEIIVSRYMENNKLGFAGRQIQTAIVYLSRMMSDASFDARVLRMQAVYLQSLLKERQTTLSSEVNGLIDYADMLFNDERGEPLFDALRDFEAYPNTTKKAWQVCYNLIRNFIEPFREISYTERGQNLLNKLNKALYDRFGEDHLKSYRKWMEGLMIMRGGAAPKSDIISLKRKRGLHRLTNQKVNDHERRQYYEYQTPWVPSLRSLLPITLRQLRFRVITPRQLPWTSVDLNVVRPTLEYRRRRSLPTHPPSDMLQLFPRVLAEKKRSMLSTTQH